MPTLGTVAKADSLGLTATWSSRSEPNYRDPVPISYVPCDFGTMLIFPLSNNLIRNAEDRCGANNSRVRKSGLRRRDD